ncbi:hypothetical protein KBC70_00470 [Candidatus Woesebacteria bacterium]|jgi:hypothetical protein|nr:hypothetical protein [Candidatus Woesebacteria bacterium]
MIKHLLVTLIVCLGFLGTVQSAQAAYLFLDPQTKSVAVSDIVTVNVRINTEEEKVQGAEAWIDFDATQLELIDVKDPEASQKFFSNDIVTKNSPKLIYIVNWINLDGEAISSTPPKDAIAVMRFKALKAGTHALTLRCKDGETKDSAIAVRKNKKTTDVIQCAKVKNGSYSVGGASTGTTPGTSPEPTLPGRATPVVTQTQSTNTPTPTLKPGAPTNTPTLTPTPSPTRVPTLKPTIVATGGAAITQGPLASPSALPKSGEVGSIGIVVGIGLLLTAISIFVKVFVL